MSKVHTRFGTSVEIIGVLYDDENCILCKREDGTVKEFHISDLRVEGGAEVLDRLIKEAVQRNYPILS